MKFNSDVPKAQNLPIFFGIQRYFAKKITNTPLSFDTQQFILKDILYVHERKDIKGTLLHHHHSSYLYYKMISIVFNINLPFQYQIRWTFVSIQCYWEILVIKSLRCPNKNRHYYTNLFHWLALHWIQHVHVMLFEGFQDLPAAVYVLLMVYLKMKHQSKHWVYIKENIESRKVELVLYIYSLSLVVYILYMYILSM